MTTGLRNALHVIIIVTTCLTSSHGAVGAEKAESESLPRWRDWPNWRGPFCNGSAPSCGQPLVDDHSKVKLLWVSEEKTKSGLRPTPEWTKQYKAKKGCPLWQYATFAIVDRRLYFTYNQRRGEPTEVSRNVARMTDRGTGKGKKPPFDELSSEAQANFAGVHGEDVYMCLDAVTGRTLWKTAHQDSINAALFCRRPVYWPQNVPCWGHGRLFGHGASMHIYAMDAVTGEPLWESDGGNTTWKFQYQWMDANLNGRATPSDGNWGGDGLQFTDSMIVAGNAVVGRVHDRWHKAAASAVTALDVRTGRRLWTLRDGLLSHFNSPVRWCAPDGREYVILVGHQQARCIDPDTGKTMWHIKGSPLPRGAGTPAVNADYMLVQGCYEKDGKKMGGLAAYRITPQKAELAWDKTRPRGGSDIASPGIHGNLAFMGRSYDLATGAAKGPPLAGAHAKAVTMADGFYFLKSSAKSLDGTKSFELRNMASVTCEQYGEATVVLGRWFVRGKYRWMCYDLRQDPSVEDRYSKPVARDYEIDSLYEPLKGLASAYWTDRKAAVERIPTDDAKVPLELARLIIEAPYPVAKSACEALCRLGEKAKSQAKVLARALADCVEKGGYGRVQLVTKAVNVLDPNAFAEQATSLLPLLEKDDDLIRFRACKALEKMGKHGAPAVPGLIKLLKSGDVYLSRNAALALAGIGPAAGAEASVALAALIKDPEPEILVHALAGLKAVGGELSDETLATLMEYAFTERAQALKVAPFADFINSRNFVESHPHYVSYLAGQCLGASDPERVIPLVLAHLKKCTAKNKKGRRGRPWIMHYMVLGWMGPKAASTVPVLSEALPWFDLAIQAKCRDVGFFFLNRIEPGTGDKVRAKLSASRKKK